MTDKSEIRNPSGFRAQTTEPSEEAKSWIPGFLEDEYSGTNTQDSTTSHGRRSIRKQATLLRTFSPIESEDFPCPIDTVTRCTVASKGVGTRVVCPIAQAIEDGQRSFPKEKGTDQEGLATR
ncbi:hypothetical protein KPH14_011076 [Odynerus spinipes]|uniref:Uncharacterized protein n=1 Tax=Odynerus spinipes TaxID=1348599 RepID=A0AAD9RHH4_9HYME|nr:hypothetical protein KPH14_011076 [Odynerus spinipes]